MASREDRIAELAGYRRQDLVGLVLHQDERINGLEDEVRFLRDEMRAARRRADRLDELDRRMNWIENNHPTVLLKEENRKQHQLLLKVVGS